MAVENAESIDTLLVDHAGRPTLTTTVRAGRIFRIGYGYTAGSLTDQITVRRDSASSIPWADTINVGYNAARRAYQFMDFGNKTTTLLVDAAGREITDSLPTSTTPASKVRKSIGYSAASQVLTEAFSGSAATALNRTYGGYDATDRIGTILRPTGTPYPITRYHQYDAMGRLGYYEDVQEQIIGWDYVCDEQCQEWGTPPDSTPYYWPVAFRSATYSYDKVANRTDLGATITTGNRMTGLDGWTITYDDAGNLTKRKKGADSLTYAWNALGQLVQVTSSVPSYTVTYGYDGLGRRVRKTVNSTATRYLVDGDRVLVELDNSWLPAAKYSYYPGVDRPHAMVRAGKRYYFAQDGQGNVTGLLDSVGTAVQQYDYTPYGEALPGSGSVVNPYQYKGREWDAEARLSFMRARYYDPQVGRFISEDPIGLAGGNNPTRFVGSDPVNRSDPRGTFCQLVQDMKTSSEDRAVFRYVGTSCDDDGAGGWDWTPMGSQPFLPRPGLDITPFGGRRIGSAGQSQQGTRYPWPGAIVGHSEMIGCPTSASFVVAAPRINDRFTLDAWAYDLTRRNKPHWSAWGLLTRTKIAMYSGQLTSSDFPGGITVEGNMNCARGVGVLYPQVKR